MSAPRTRRRHPLSGPLALIALAAAVIAVAAVPLTTPPAHAADPAPAPAAAGPASSTPPPAPTSTGTPWTPSPYPTGNTPPGTPPTRPPDTCQVNYMVTHEWPGGFQAAVRIVNTGIVAHPDWTLQWRYLNGQQITQLWNGSYQQEGEQVTITPAAWTASLPAGGAIEFGLLGRWDTFNNRPISVYLDGTFCLIF